MPATQPQRSLRVPSLIGGFSLLAMAILAFAGTALVDPLTSSGNPSASSNSVADSVVQLRWGVAALIAVVMLDVVVAAALFKVLSPVNASLAQTAAWFRLAYAAVFLVAIGQLAGALAMPDDVDRVSASANAFDVTWNVGLVLFGAHLVLIGVLAWRSEFVPRLVGALLVVAGSGYLIDSFGSVLVADYSISIAQFAFVGEVALMGWLVVVGRTVVVAEKPHTATVFSAH